MNKAFISTIKNILFIGILFFALSCSNDKEDLLNTDQQVTSTEVKTIFEVDDFSSAADNVLTEIFKNNLTGKRTLTSNECFEVNYSDTGYTVVFTNCELDSIEHVVNGTLVVSLTVGEEASTYTVSFTDFMVGDVEINGTRIFTVLSSNESSINFSVTSDMSIELENEFLVQESGSKTLLVVIDTENIANSGLSVEGSWTVIVDDNVYVIEVTSALQTNLDCFYIFTEGVIDLSKNGVQVASIDFGDGTCDNTVELTYPDTTKEEIALKD